MCPTALPHNARGGAFVQRLFQRFLNRRLGREPVVYPHPSLAPILKETNGIVIFQEQVLRIAHALAGYSFGQADLLRRAMTKLRSTGEMERLRDGFIEGCLSRGVSLEAAEEVWRIIAAFAGFGFCKAHATSFAYLTYQSAYLKAHHPLEFYVGLLNAGHVGSYPPSVFINEARRRGYRILSPHVSFSGREYLVEDGGIRVPLHLIIGVGPGTVERILRARAERPFTSRRDFARRTGLPRKVLATLIEAEALDGLPVTEPEELRQ